MSNDDSSIIIRIFSSTGCKRCKMFKEECQKFGLPHLIIDANADKNQDICDKYEVNQLPHIQIVRQNSGLVMLEYAGYIHPISFLNTFKKRLKAQTSARVKVQTIGDDEISNNTECKECRKKKNKHQAPSLSEDNKGCSKCGKKKKNEIK